MLRDRDQDHQGKCPKEWKHYLKTSKIYDVLYVKVIFVIELLEDDKCKSHCISISFPISITEKRKTKTDVLFIHL